ncbi:MAG TPA: ATP-binding protein, partial [Longimicrobiaceae bacterium]|nr:ATP-binding protein [Longimicrobiaceae bacterium]
PVDVVPLAAEVVEIGQALAGDRPVRLRLDGAEHAIVMGNAGPLRRLLLNLVSNAVKFTERGDVAVTIREVPAAPLPAPPAAVDPLAEPANTTGWVLIEVRDTGTGIAADELVRVFDRFYRADAARERSGGTGLGLAIGRMIAQQHGGDIEAESIPGEGSVFRVRLPRAADLIAD